MDLDIIILHEVRQRILLKCRIKKNASKHIYRTEIDSQTQKTSIWFLKNRGEGIN